MPPEDDAVDTNSADVEQDNDGTIEVDKDSENSSPEEKSISQTELDRILQKRLKRQEEQLSKKYGDYDQLKQDAEAFRKIADEKATDAERWEKEKANLLSQATDFQTELTKLQRTNLITDLATDAGLPKSFWKRVSGDSSEEIEEDIADILKDLGLPKDDKEPNAKKAPSQQKKVVYGGGGENQEPDPDVDKIVNGIPRGPQIRVDKPRSYK